MMIDRKFLLLAVSLAMLAAAPVMAQEQPTAALAYYSIDNIILLLCAVLVLFMQAGFAALESGLSPVNNTVNIMFKNLTGVHETASFEKFSYGVSDRIASIRIPIYTVEHGWKGYLEDRRPASNADPYRVTARIIETVREAHNKAR